MGVNVAVGVDVTVGVAVHVGVAVDVGRGVALAVATGVAASDGTGVATGVTVRGAAVAAYDRRPLCDLQPAGRSATRSTQTISEKVVRRMVYCRARNMLIARWP